MSKIRLPIFIFLLVLALVSLSSFVHPTKVNAQECGSPVPPAPSKVTTQSGPNPGEVTLFWEGASYANRYAVAYGTIPGKYIYGAGNIGGEKSRFYTVRYLQPGTRYYFRLAAARDCSSSPFSAEVTGLAMSGAATLPVGQIGAPAVHVMGPSIPVQVGTGGPVGKQKLLATSGPKAGEVTLYWQHVDSADNYHLIYGRQLDKFQYGALSIGKITSFTVGKLTPGMSYYFALIPLMNGRPLYTTPQVMAKAKMNAQVVQTTPEALIQPPPPPPVIETPPPPLQQPQTEDITTPQTQGENPPQAVGGASEIQAQGENPPQVQGAQTGPEDENTPYAVGENPPGAQGVNPSEE